jgi:3-phosphoshikimate 1-carboxyvinyltransferase
MSNAAEQDAQASILHLQQLVDQWIETVGVRYFNELTNMAILTEEVGEVARIIARQYGEQSPKAGEVLDLGEELADVLFVVLCLANQTKTPLADAFVQKMAQKTRRDAERHRNNPSLQSLSFSEADTQSTLLDD